MKGNASNTGVALALVRIGRTASYRVTRSDESNGKGVEYVFEGTDLAAPVVLRVQQVRTATELVVVPTHTVRRRRTMAPSDEQIEAVLVLATRLLGELHERTAAWPVGVPPVRGEAGRTHSVENLLHEALHRLAARYFLASRIRRFRVETGVSLRAIAEQTNLAHTYLGRMERGVSGLPPADACQLLLELIGVETWGPPSEEKAHGSRGAGEDTTREVAGAGASDARATALRLLWRHVTLLPAEVVLALADLARHLRPMPKYGARVGRDTNGGRHEPESCDGFSM